MDVDGGKFRVLYHGTTAHGSEQRLDGDGAPLTTRRQNRSTYYYRGGPFSQAIYAMRASMGGTIPRVALVGLGVGALTCYRQPGEDWTIYELDPLIVDIARDRSLFRSVSVLRAEHTDRDRRRPPDACAPPSPASIYLMLDIFSSDSVPLAHADARGVRAVQVAARRRMARSRSTFPTRTWNWPMRSRRLPQPTAW